MSAPVHVNINVNASSGHPSTFLLLPMSRSIYKTRMKSMTTVISTNAKRVTKQLIMMASALSGLMTVFILQNRGSV